MYQLQCISLQSGAPMPIPAETVLCLGNFDGVHLAHRRLMGRALLERDRICPEAAVGVFCFRQLPARFLGGEFQGLLCSSEERLARFWSCGMEFAILAEFPDLRGLSAEEYVCNVLKGRCHAVAVACGFNHRFGKNGAGTPDLLQKHFGQRVFLQEAITLNGQTVSSTRIRTLLQEGEAEEAAELLTVPYHIHAPVLHGKALGRRMGTPTVNQCFPKDAVIPAHGVYVTECVVNGQSYRGVTNVGIRPTVEADGQVNCETYLLDFDGDLYDERLTVRFLKFIRKEKKFDSTEALWEQIRADIEAAKRF